MYGWFAHAFLGRPTSSPSRRRFLRNPQTPNSECIRKDVPTRRPVLPEFAAQWIQRRQAELASPQPTNRTTFTNYLRTFVPSWARIMAIEGADRPASNRGSLRQGAVRDRVERRLLLPEGDQFTSAVVLVHPEGRKAITRAARVRILPGGCWTIESQSSPSTLPVLRCPNSKPPQDRSVTQMVTTYNRTVLQERVGDILNAVAYLRQVVRPKRIILVGDGPAGIWALLAARAADVVVADAGALDLTEDRALLAPELFLPGIRLIGVPTARPPSPPPSALDSSYWQSVPDSWTTAAYTAAEASDELRVSPDAASKRTFFIGF